MESRSDEGWLRAMEVATLCSLPLAVRAAIQLNVMEILAQHAGELQAGGAQKKYLSASEIVSHFDCPALAPSTTAEQASASLDRILSVLACHGLLSSSLTSPAGGGGDEGSGLPPVRTYGLTSSSRYLLQSESQSSLAPMLLFNLDPLVIQPFFHLHEAVLDGATPFLKAHDIPYWPFLQRHPRLHSLFNRTMANFSNPLISNLLETYHGFEDITSLVDVGGGIGASLHMITSKHPHIKGINFDQAHVIANAPQYPGIQHVGGDMFEEIPQASAIFMKSILHDWSDAHCSKILDNCYRALPKKAKVILVDNILPVKVDCELHSRVKYQMDLLMFAYTQGGRERTQTELEIMSKASGFSRLQVICSFNGSSVVELYKEPSTNSTTIP